MSDDRNIREKKIRFRCHHMGTVENDVIFGGFADTRLADLSDADLDRLEALLLQNDTDLYNWISGREAPPEAFDTALFRMIQDFKDGRQYFE